MSVSSLNPYNVRIGQTWESTDSRVRNLPASTRAKTQFKVVAFNNKETHAIVERVFKQSGYPARRSISLLRFKPGSTGYKLIEEPKCGVENCGNIAVAGETCNSHGHQAGGIEIAQREGAAEAAGEAKLFKESEEILERVGIEELIGEDEMIVIEVKAS
jgi:hypothetical protein